MSKHNIDKHQRLYYNKVKTTKEDAKETIIHQTMLSNELYSKTSFACNPLQYKQK